MIFFIIDQITTGKYLLVSNYFFIFEADNYILYMLLKISKILK